ncbi:hypothetical protein, partial [Mesorhizobium sp. J18]|uniref:hypothetical protein n=1 Tax=Mesorhizobium sp. J18 TaxID=935263 RepID=UPI001AEE37F3
MAASSRRWHASLAAETWVPNTLRFASRSRTTRVGRYRQIADLRDWLRQYRTSPHPFHSMIVAGCFIPP